MLAEQIQADLTAAMKSRDELTLSVLRMATAAIKEARVSGDEARELTDGEVLAILSKEAKRREEAAASFTEGGRPEKAERELAERHVLAKYLPQPLTDAELEAVVDQLIAEGGFSSMKDMGAVMKAATAAVAGRADGKAVSALVKAKLA